jgi:hypothetical protein
MKPPEQVRDQQVNLSLNRAGLDVLDADRGTWTRQEWIRQAMALAHRQGLRGPTPKGSF